VGGDRVAGAAPDAERPAGAEAPHRAQRADVARAAAGQRGPVDVVTTTLRVTLIMGGLALIVAGAGALIIATSDQLAARIGGAVVLVLGAVMLGMGTSYRGGWKG
jgi:hypothetical protein